MSYCTVEDLRRVLPESITIGDRNIGTPTPGRVGGSRSKVNTTDAYHYIDYAQQQIDAELRPFYVSPLRRTKSFETHLVSDVSAGSNVSIVVSDSGSFIKGQLVRLQNKVQMELVTVGSVTDLTTFVAETVVNSYSLNDSKVSIVEYPDPLPIMTARWAVSLVIDRLFVGEQSPDISNYGKAQMEQAYAMMDGILQGKILLLGQEHTGRRFIRGSLYNAYSNPTDMQNSSRPGMGT